MSFNISEFTAAGLLYGGARPSLFDVKIFSPWASQNEQRTTMLVSASSLPASPVHQIPVYYFGRNIKLAGNRDFGEWEVEIMNDEDFALRIMFENWSNKINALISNRQDEQAIANGYKSSAIVSQYNQDKSIAREYEMIGIWPTMISPIGLSWERGNAIETYSVTFSVDWWEPMDSGARANPDDYSGTLQSDGRAG